jgi:Spy/CpxP family protein refolding chaperone
MKSLRMLALIILLGFAGSAMAQGWMDEPPPDGPPPFSDGPRAEKIRERIQTVKIWKLTETLELTPEQSQKFFPVYNAYQDARMALEKERFDTFHELSDLLDKEQPSDKEIIALLDKLDSFDGKIQANQAKFRNNVKDILTIQQLGRLYVFEVQFMQQIRGIVKDARMEMRDKHPQRGK